MDDVADALRAAREARRRHDWSRAHALFVESRAETTLSPDDLDSLSNVAWWLGNVDECLEAGEAAFAGYLDRDRPHEAARAAIELAVSLFLRGDEALGSGWLGRAQRLLEDLPEGRHHGYLCFIVEVEAQLESKDLTDVVDAAREVRGIGRRHGDPNLVALGTLGEGRALVKLGDVPNGMRLLDEAMVAVLHDDLDLEWAGNIYCHLMAVCHELEDIRRAREWTDATEAWLSTLPTAVLFTGICRVHRAQVHHVRGEWDRAEQEASRVVQELADLHVASVAEAHYQLGEMQRLRGELDAADETYLRARELGRDPQPGLALLRLAQGRVDAAQAAISSALHAVSADRLARARLCAALVEIALAAGELDAAGEACAELEAAATSYGTSGLEAAALHWRGAVALAEERPQEALPALRAACRRWREVQAPYDAARTCVLLAETYRRLDDHESAASELAAARKTFAELGATVDSLGMSERSGPPTLPGGLTEREAEVLALVATGRTNREVAGELVLSEKTIARHLANIFVKLRVSTRTEAAAVAFEHGLAPRGRG